VLRWESPIQTFFRTTTRTVDIGGIEIPQDAKVLLFLASANRISRCTHTVSTSGAEKYGYCFAAPGAVVQARVRDRRVEVSKYMIRRGGPPSQTWQTEATIHDQNKNENKP
jgi:hypothetical protein